MLKLMLCGLRDRTEKMSTNKASARCVEFRIHYSTGLSLIEVLIALLVLSIGLVGLASLQLISLKSAHSSYYRSLASAAALDTEERLWLRMRQENLKDSSTEKCMSDTVIASVIAESQGAWRPNVTETARKAGIPNLTITSGTEPDGTISQTANTRADTGNVGDWTYRWQQIPIRLTWVENRLEDGGESDFIESFDYVVRIPCISEWVPPTT